MKKTKTVTFDEAVTAIKASFLAFSKVWWRIALINVSMTLMIGLGLVLAVLMFILGVGGLEGVQLIMANVSMNPEVGEQLIRDRSVLFILIFLLIFLWVMTFSILGKIANYLTLKNYAGKKTEDPFTLYFVRSWEYFVKYVLVSLRVFWYIFWPVLLCVVLGLTVFAIILVLSEGGMLGTDDNLRATNTGFLIFGLLGLSFIPMLFISVWRAINAVFALPFSIHSKKEAMECFEDGLKLVKGNFWVVFGGFFVIGAVTTFFGGAFSILEEVYKNTEPTIFFIQGLDFLLNFFIFTPIVISFMYIFMAHVAKIKHIK